MCSEGIWIMSPSSTMLDLAVSPLLDLREPLKTIKLAPVTKKINNYILVTLK